MYAVVDKMPIPTEPNSCIVIGKGLSTSRIANRVPETGWVP